MPVRPRLSILIFLVSMVGAVIMAAMGAFIVLGGYWENMAFLDRLSGPWRFREFVASPIPMSVHDVRGGYSGFPFGKIRTVFAFTDEYFRSSTSGRKSRDPKQKGKRSVLIFQPPRYSEWVGMNSC